MKISACILTYNSAKKIEKLLKSLDFVDEIVAVDGGPDGKSTDDTLKILKKYTNKIYFKKLQNMGEQRNFSTSKAANDWVLALDSDEVISKTLAQEIKQASQKDFDGYWLPRKTYFAGKPIMHSGWYPDFAVRLYNRQKMSFNAANVHEKVVPSGKVSFLKNAIDHYSYDAVKDYFGRFKRYSAMQVDNANTPKGHSNLFLMLLKPLYRFFSMYFLKLGFLDGWRGLFLAVMSSAYDFRVHYLAEKRALSRLNFLFLMILIVLVTLFQGYIIARFGLLGLMLPISVAVLLMVFCNLNAALALVFLSILTGQLTRLGFSAGGGIVASDIMVPMFILSWLIYKAFKNPKFFKAPISMSLTAVMVVLVVTFGLSAFNYFSLSASFYLLRLLVYLSLFWPFYDILKNQKSFAFSTKMFEYLMYGLIILGFLQLKFFPNLHSLALIGWDPHKNRMVSTFLDPNFLAAFLNIGFAYFLAKYYSSKEPIWIKVWPILITGLAVALTVSRSGWLMLAVIVFIFALFRDRRLFLVAAAVLLFVLELVPLFSQKIMAGVNFQDSAALRLASWSEGYQIIKQNIILGVGYNNLEQVKIAQGFLTQAQSQSHSAAGIDSSLMVIWATTGIIGLITFLYFLLKNIYLGFKEFFRQSAPFTANMGLAVAGILIGILIHSLFVNSLLYPPIVAAIMFVLSVFYVLVKYEKIA